MKEKVYIGLLVILVSVIASSLHAQGRLAVGFDLETIYCLTDLSPRVQSDYSTRAVQKDLFNLKGGFDAEYKFDFGFGISLGTNFARKRFGFIHEAGAEPDVVNLWGHSEYYSLSIPLMISYEVMEDNDPYYELAPFLGFAFGRDFTSYRNLTRLDDNNNYSYILNKDFPGASWSMSAMVGVKFRTMIEQLGLISWTLGFSYDLSKLPPFEYQVDIAGAVTDYSQDIRMHYISLGMCYYFSNWEIFDGRFMRRKY